MSHPVAVMQTAKRLYLAGWNATEVSRLIKREHGVHVHPQTIRMWSDDARRQHRLDTDRDRKARDRAAVHDGRLRSRGIAYRPEFVEQRIVALHGIGISDRAISALIDFDFDVQITRHQIRHRLAKARASA